MREVVEIEMPHSTFTLYKSVEEQSQASEHTNCSPYTSILGKMPKLTKSVKLHVSGKARGTRKNFPSFKRLSSHHPCTPYASKGGKSVKLNLNDTSITGKMEPKCMYTVFQIFHARCNILEDTWSFWGCEVVKHKWNERMDQFWSEGMFYSWGCELLDLDLTWKDHAGQTKPGQSITFEHCGVTTSA